MLLRFVTIRYHADSNDAFNSIIVVTYYETRDKYIAYINTFNSIIVVTRGSDMRYRVWFKGFQFYYCCYGLRVEFVHGELSGTFNSIIVVTQISFKVWRSFVNPFNSIIVVTTGRSLMCCPSKKRSFNSIIVVTPPRNYYWYVIATFFQFYYCCYVRTHVVMH